MNPNVKFGIGLIHWSRRVAPSTAVALPAGQLEQIGCPISELYVFKGQIEHVRWPVRSVKLPAGQALQFMNPDCEKYPTAHG